MSITWRIARLKRMSPPEVYWRFQQSFLAAKDALAPRKSATADKATEIRAILPPLSQSFTIVYFAVSRPWHGEDIPWQDPVAMKFNPTAHWSKINYRDTQRNGDPKVVWELSRHQFLRQWVLDDTVDVSTRANAVSHLILHWIEKNPVGYGLNWCSSLEVALRLISWETAIVTLGDENFHIRVRRAIHRSTVEHAAHLRRFPSLHSSANNHRIGELLGELAAAALFPDEDLLTHAWKAWHQLQEEAALQVSSDGVSREQATWYHAYVLLYLRRAAEYAVQLAFPVPLEFRELLNKMQAFLNAATSATGQWFEIGDRDDGDLQALLPWTPVSPPVSEPAANGFYQFPDGGYAIWQSDTLHALFRCGQFGYPSIAAHSHADQLSLLLNLNGHSILTDSGTGSYHDAPRWRRYFRGTPAHNTVLIDSTDQATYGGPFLWNTAPEGHIKFDTELNTASGMVTYPTPNGQVTHQRTVQLPTNGPLILVSDSAYQNIPSDTPSQFELIWNLDPGVSASLIPLEVPENNRFNFRLTSDKFSSVHMLIETSANATSQIYNGDENLPAGFYSRQFGQRLPIIQLRIVCQGQAVTFKTKLFLDAQT